MAKRILRELRLDKIAAVDKPCQEGATMAIIKRAVDADEQYWKRDFTDKERQHLADTGAAMPDGSFPIRNEADLKNAIHAIGRAKDEAAAKKHITSRAHSLGLTQLLPDGWVSKSAGMSGSHPDTKGDPSMSDIEKKVGELETQIAELNKTIEKANADKAAAEALVAKAESLTPKEMEFMNGLSAAEKKKFMAAESSERSTMMSKAADSDPVVYKAADGTEFRKSHDPMLVNLAKRADEAEKLAKAEREAREMGEFTKRASDEFNALPGETIAKAKVLKAVAAMGDEERNALDAMLKAGNAAIAKGFDRFGTNPGVAAEGPEAKLEAMSKARMEKDASITKAAAMSAVLATPEGQALYSEMRNSRMSAE